MSDSSHNEKKVTNYIIKVNLQDVPIEPEKDILINYNNSNSNIKSIYRDQDNYFKKFRSYQDYSILPKEHQSKTSAILSNYDLLPKYDNYISESGTIGNNTIVNQNRTLKKVKFHVKQKIFWSKEKLEEIREKIKRAKDAILKKTKSDFEELQIDILNNNNTEVEKKLLNPEFKKFYKLHLPKSKILEFMVVHNKMQLLEKILKDNFYHFPKNFIFNYLTKMLCPNYIRDPNDELIIKNLIFYNFYELHHFKLLLWIMSLMKFQEEFNLMYSKKSLLTDFNIKDNEDFEKYSEDVNNYSDALIQCLEFGFQDIATLLVRYFQELNNEEVVEIAVKKSSMKFLRFCWELSFVDIRKGTKDENQHDLSYSYLNKSLSNNNLSMSNFKSKLGQLQGLNELFNNGYTPFKPSLLIDKFIFLDKVDEVNDIIKWNFLEYDTDFLKKLFKIKKFDQISQLITNSKKFNSLLTKDMFKTVIENDELDLILFFLKRRDCRLILEDHQIQSRIVDKFICSGNKIYYASEMLSYIYKLAWNNDLTKDLTRNILQTIKKSEIVNCHSPILTCMLLCEFLTVISDISIQNTTRCSKAKGELMELSKNIQNSSIDENYIKYLMTQKDTRKRTTLQVASENNFFEVLQNPEIGTIVGKMWNGKISHNGLFPASSLYNYVNSYPKSRDPFKSFEPVDMKKNYIFQFDVWTDSCTLRFIPESISTIILIIIYNYYMANLVHRDAVKIHYLNYQENNLHDLLFFLYLYTAWNTVIVMNIFNQLFFSLFTGRTFKLDKMQITDIVSLLFTISLFIDMNSLSTYNTDSLDFVQKVRAGLLGVNNVLVWMRITGIFMTFKEVGPMISLMIEMSFLLFKYIILYALWVICAAAIFTSIFYRYSPMFKVFSSSVFNLLGGFIQNFNITNFSDYITLGEIMFMIFITISGILLINLLIAILGNVYDEMSQVVDASHRSVIISYYKRFRWEKNYGYLIFLTTPLNAINFIVLPITLFFSKQNRIYINNIVAKCYYIIYFFAILLIFMIVTIAFIPLCYFRSVSLSFDNISVRKINFLRKLVRFICWIFVGLFYITFYYFRDIYVIFQNIFNKIVIEEGETARIKKYLTNEDVKIFLQFIHSRKENKGLDKEDKDPNEIHNIFFDYLFFEQKMTEENENEHLKEEIGYMKRINTSKKFNLIFKGRNFEKEKTFFGKYMKKNVIIIEILQNFLYDDFENPLKNKVDIEKIKKILPKTMNVDSKYIKRLVNSNISYINFAINALKFKKDVFSQFQMLNNILDIAKKIDKEIDTEITKIYSRKKLIDKRKSELEVDRIDDSDKNLETFLKILETIKKEIKRKQNETGIDHAMSSSSSDSD